MKFMKYVTKPVEDSKLNTITVVSSWNPQHAEILFDGKPMHGVRRLEYVLDAKEIPVLKLELETNVVIDGVLDKVVTKGQAG